MRKLFFLFVTLVATTCLWAYDFQSGDLYYNITSSSEPYTVEVTFQNEWSFDNYAGLATATIPENVTYNGTTYSVTSIGDYAFYYCFSLTSLTIPNSVTRIGDDAFCLCSSLTSVTIPNSVTSIGSSAFYYCFSLTSITIPNSVTSIGDRAFYDCYALTSITIPNSVTSIVESAFSGCSSLTSITIPNSVTSIVESAFSGCSSLTSIIVEGGNTIYDSRENCNAIVETATNTLIVGCQSTIIPNSVTSIGNYAFYACSSLTSITIPNSVASIGESAFEGCSSLTSITIPNSVASIGESAFGGCSSLVSVTIPNSVTTMGGAVFSGCSSLESVFLLANITSILGYWYGGDECLYCIGFFEGCSSLTSITFPTSLTYISDLAFKNCSSLKSITIPDNVTELGSGLFSGCSSLESVVFSKNLRYIGGNHTVCGWDTTYNFFGNCTSLTEITMRSETPPTIYDDIFNDLSNYSVYVPCGTVTTYMTVEGWANVQEPPAEYSINLSISNSQMGSARVDYNTICDDAQISAEPYYGYHFVQWSDGLTDNPRSLTLTQDTTFVAVFAPNNYTISTLSSDIERGTTSGDITTTYLDYVTISATANYGYHFSCWDDYNYDNPRQVQVTEDKTYTAYFDKNTYYITKNYDSNQGYVDGYSSGEYLDNITLIAEPIYGYHFVRWADGNTDNPRHFILTQDTTFSAEFAQTFSGQCGDNLYWSYQNNSLIISGFGEMYDERPWGLFTNEIQTVVLPNGITHIGNDAFSDCTGLNEITIPYTVTSIGDYAFAGCRKLVHVNCYAINPPMAESTSFANYNVYLNVPCDNLQDYQLDMVFGSFKYIQCMEADSENVPTDDVVVTPGTNDVTITWPTAENADTYTIVIQKGNEVFCTLTFNAEGQLLNIAFAPSRDGNNRPAQYAEQAGNGYRFTVTGLEAGTDYTYDITVKDASNQTINSHTGEFSTQSTTAVDNIPSPTTTCQKLLRDGQLLILRDGKTYTVMGQEL